MKCKIIKNVFVTVIMGMLLCFFITGCISKSGIISSQKRANEVLPTIRYKYDVNAAFGQMTAIYNNHLYYWDTKDSRTGIYKRNLLSEQEELIIEVESTRKIQVTEDGIYYIGRTPENDIEENYPEGKWNTYQLFFHEGYDKSGTADKLISESVIAWDFYVSGKNLFLVTNESTIPTGQYYLYKYICTNAGDYVKWEDEMVLLDDSTDKKLSKYQDLVFWSESELYNLGEVIAASIASVYDEGMGGTTYLTSDRLLQSELAEPCILLTDYKGHYLCSINDTIYLVNDNGVYKQRVIDSVEWIKFGFKKEKIMYLVAETKGQESLLQLDLDIFEAEELQKLEKNEKLVAMTEKGFICVNKKSTVMRDLTTGKIIKEQKWDKKVDWSSDTVEVAGDYIFVYEYKDGMLIKDMQKLNW